MIMGKSMVETLMGAVVVAVAVGFLVYAYNRSNVETVDGYVVSAKFSRVDGLSEGSDVRLGGIKIGSIIEQKIDPVSYKAIVRMSIDPDYQLPLDSSASVVSDGLLGGKYLSLSPGADERMIAPDGEIRFTQGAINIEELLGKFMFGTERP